MVIFEVCAYLFEFKEGENFNHSNTYSISRIALKLHCVPKFESDVEIGQKVPFCKGLIVPMADKGKFLENDNILL